MTLANPIFLAALGLLFPILITFLVRRQRRIVRVPSTMLWRLGAKSVSKNRRIRDVRRLIALLACLAGVALLALAAARPGGKGFTTTVYVVDSSASMSGAPIEDARTFLGREVAGLGPNGRVAIVLAGAEPQVVLPPSPPGPLVDRAIAQIAVAKESSSLEEAIGLAEGLAAAHHARVVVLTDHALEKEASRTGKTEQHVFNRGTKTDNLGIVSLFTRTSPDAHDDEEREATIVVATSSTIARRGRLVVTFADRVLSDRSIDVPAKGETTTNVTLRGSGKLVARIASDDGKGDALAIDDEAMVVESARKAPSVTLVRKKDDPAATYFFVSRALKAAGVTDVVDVDSESPAPFPRDVVVVLHEGSARPHDAPTFYIHTWTAELGLDARGVDRKSAHLRSIAAEDPLLRGVALDELTSTRALIGTPPKGARSLIELDGGPALIAGGAGKNAWVWLGIDPEASDLVLRVAFPVLVGNVLTHLGGATQVIAAKTVPRDEVMLAHGDVPVALTAASEPRWRMPLGPAALIATLASLLLAFEAWFSWSLRDQRERVPCESHGRRTMKKPA